MCATQKHTSKSTVQRKQCRSNNVEDFVITKCAAAYLGYSRAEVWRWTTADWPNFIAQRSHRQQQSVTKYTTIV